MRLGAHAHRRPKAAQIAVDALGSFVPLGSPTQISVCRDGKSEAERGSEAQLCADLCMHISHRWNPLMLPTPSLSLPCNAIKATVSPVLTAWTGPMQFGPCLELDHSHQIPAVRRGLGCSLCTWELLGRHWEDDGINNG